MLNFGQIFSQQAVLPISTIANLTFDLKNPCKFWTSLCIFTNLTLTSHVKFYVENFFFTCLILRIHNSDSPLPHSLIFIFFYFFLKDNQTLAENIFCPEPINPFTLRLSFWSSSKGFNPHHPLLPLFERLLIVWFNFPNAVAAVLLIFHTIVPPSSSFLCMEIHELGFPFPTVDHLVHKT